MKIVNLTGHLVVLEDHGGRRVVYESEGRARVASRPKPLDHIVLEGTSTFTIYLPRIIQSERRILDLPDPAPNTLYIVSAIVAESTDRSDVWAIGRKVANGGTVEAGRALIRYEKG